MRPQRARQVLGQDPVEKLVKTPGSHSGWLHRICNPVPNGHASSNLAPGSKTKCRMIHELHHSCRLHGPVAQWNKSNRLLSGRPQVRILSGLQSPRVINLAPERFETLDWLWCNGAQQNEVTTVHMRTVKWDAGLRFEPLLVSKPSFFRLPLRSKILRRKK